MTDTDKAVAQLHDLERVLSRWAEAMPQALVDNQARDSAILRFELAYEVGWRLLQTLSRRHGLSADSPRAAFSTAFQLSWVTDEVVWADIIQARNDAVHVYHEPLASRLASALPRYLAAFRELAAAASRELSE